MPDRLVNIFLIFLISIIISQSTFSMGDEGNNANSDLFYAPDKIVEVKITMNEKDWEALRKERHNIIAALGPERIKNPEPDPYNTYKAEVEINGTKLGPVGIKKRGFLGSSSFSRPSLGIKLNEYDKNIRFSGLKRINLNNNLQDPSLIHQYLTYKVFSLAGVAAPRCNFARVYVNGKYLGIYSNVEAVNDGFLKRCFGDDSGNLYEGQLSDFRPEWVETFEKKNNKNAKNDDLRKLTKAFESNDERLLAELENLIDLDQYLTFWAAEVLTGHWDCYSNNGNNFFVYNDPKRGKFVFIPWGADSTFGDPDPFTPADKPKSVIATSILPFRLYRIEKTREQYRERLRKLLSTIWNEKELLNEVDRLEKMLKPHLHTDSNHFAEAVNRVRNFIKTRRQTLLKELDGPAPEWKLPLRKSPCLEKIGSFNAEFSTYWRGISFNNWDNQSSLDIRMSLNGRRQWFLAKGVSASAARDERFFGFPSLVFFCIEMFSGKWLLPVFIIEPEMVETNKPIIIDGTGVLGILIEGKALNINVKSLNVMGGKLVFENISTNIDGKVSGKIQADIYRFFQWNE
ncbi:MAG: CotH kinase family protein [Verrucomicrobiia bacterium]